VVEDVQSTGKDAVVSVSLGGTPSDAVDDAVNMLALRYGIHVVVAASNYNSDASNYSPARAAEAVTVGASDISDVRESHSNYGPAVALFAPGRMILSAGIENDDGITIGGRTSAATPHVAGIAAYWINLYNSNIPTRAMKNLLREVATKNALSDLPAGTANLLANNNSDDDESLEGYFKPK
jgi:cerevisin